MAAYQICRHFWKGNCDRGFYCKFQHILPGDDAEICKHYAVAKFDEKSGCRFGETCFKRHMTAGEIERFQDMAYRALDKIWNSLQNTDHESGSSEEDSSETEDECYSQEDEQENLSVAVAVPVDPPPKIFKVIFDFDGKEYENGLAVRKDQIVIAQSYGVLWTFCKCPETGKTGYVPKHFLKLET